jgi:hypothetical protein
VEYLSEVSCRGWGHFAELESGVPFSGHLERVGSFCRTTVENGVPFRGRQERIGSFCRTTVENGVPFKGHLQKVGSFAGIIYRRRGHLQGPSAEVFLRGWGKLQRSAAEGGVICRCHLLYGGLGHCLEGGATFLVRVKGRGHR